MPIDPEITTPQINNPDITAPEITTPEITTPGITTPGITTPEIPDSVPPVTPSSPAEFDLDPDAMDDEDFREERDKPRPEDWDAPPSDDVPAAQAPTPLSDDMR